MTTHAELLASCNAYRQSRGYPAYESGDVEQGIAQRWAERMASTGQFRHGGGEQIIAWSSEDEPSASVIGMWRDSPGHDAYLRSVAKLAGFGIAHGAGGWYYAGAFDGGLSSFGSPGGQSGGSVSPVRPVARPWLSLLFGFLKR